MARNKDLLVTKKNSPMEKAKRLMEITTLLKDLKVEQDDIKAHLLEITQKLGVLSLKTDKYTISRVKRITPEVVDFETLKKSLTKENVPFETREVFAEFMPATFRKLIEDGREMPGLESKTTEFISVRVK